MTKKKSLEALTAGLKTTHCIDVNYHVKVGENMTDQSNENTNQRTVLCIEDEHFIRELYSRALTKAGYKVTVISDGNQALESAKKQNYDIILLDLMIPNLTGIEILRSLKDTTLDPPVTSKIIIITN